METRWKTSSPISTCNTRTRPSSGFFKVPAHLVEKTAIVLDKMLQNPEVPSNKETLSKHEVKPEQYLQQEEKPGKTPNLIDENKVDSIGKIGCIERLPEVHQKSGTHAKLSEIAGLNPHYHQN